MKVLVTGGAGFIGSHTVVELANAGHQPVIIDDLSNSEASVLDRVNELVGAEVKAYIGDYSNQELLAEVIAKEKIESVIHFAAFKQVGESVNEPLKYYRNNVAGFINLLGCVSNCGVASLVFSSSCTVYGEPDSLPVTEASPVKAASSPYGATKQMDETILRDTAKTSNIKALALRYFNPIGAHPSAKIGELPKGTPANLVPFITQTAAGLRESLTIFGNDYPTADGTCIRDYIHVIDLAQAHVRAIEYLHTQAKGSYDVFNIGTGKGTSVLEAIKAFENASDQKLNYVFGTRRTGDIVATYASVDKANQLLGWKATKTINEAMADAWRWQQSLAR